MTKEELKLLCDIAWQEKFLELTNLRVGDEVTCLFGCNFGNAKSCNRVVDKGKGIIVRTEKGILVKSIEKYSVARERKLFPNRPYDRRTYWEYNREYVYSELSNIRMKYD